MTPATAGPVNRDPDHFHPLEIIPFFRRFPQGVGRDLIYTFIWSSLFGFAFFAISMVLGSRVLSFDTLGLQILIANLVGYSIHGLFALGDFSGVEGAAKRSGFAAKVAYFSAIPLAGVALGFWFASFIIDVAFRAFFTDSRVLLSVVTSSLAISFVLSLVFFWRERSALAEAAAAIERMRVERIEREAAHANLRALQAQIEPHFLFNTLANVTSLIDPDPATAKRMLESFIRFLRASLNATRMETTTLEDEGALIGAYLDVLQVRMGPRLRYRIDVDSAVASFTLPPMLLQPVVENAIRHGLEPKVEGGEIAVRARAEADRVAVEIADTGAGFDTMTRGGVGLTNLRDRLRLLYGERASLTIAENRPAGAVVTVRIPR